MTLTFDQVERHVRLALNGRPWLPMLDLVNGAGNIFWNLHEWEFAGEHSAQLDLRAGQDWIDLPPLIRHITAWEGTDSLNDRIHFVRSKDLLQFRTQSIYFTTTHYVAQVVHRERVRANLVGDSEKLDPATSSFWKSTAVATQVTGGVTAPNNEPTAWEIRDLLSSTVASVFQDVDQANLLPARTYCLSCYVQDVDAGAGRVKLLSGRQQFRLDLDFSSGAPVATLSTLNVPEELAEKLEGGVIADDVLAGLGWYRVWLSVPLMRDPALTNAAETWRLEIQPALGASPAIGAWNVWGVQMNEGTRPASYVKTDGAPDPRSGELVPRLDFWPAPVADQFGGFSIRYTTGWQDLEADEDPVLVPNYTHELFLELAAEYALAKEQRTKGSIAERLERLKRSQLFADTVGVDSETIPTLGRIRGGAATNRNNAVYPYSLDNFVNDPA